MPTRSILTSAFARNLLAALGVTQRGHAASHVAHLHGTTISASARRTEVGTLVFWAHAVPLKHYGHTGSALREIPRTYLRCIDPARKVSELLFALAQAEIEARPLLDAREAVYQLAEARVIPDAWSEGEPPIAAPMDYDAMSLEDCAAWTPLLQALPPK